MPTKLMTPTTPTTPTKFISGDDPNETSHPRYYLAFWFTNLNEDVDVFSCAWREDGLWTVRSRFRYSTWLRREARYEVCDREATESQVVDHAQELMRRTNVLGGPVTM